MADTLKKLSEKYALKESQSEIYGRRKIFNQRA